MNEIFTDLENDTLVNALEILYGNTNDLFFPSDSDINGKPIKECDFVEALGQVYEKMGYLVIEYNATTRKFKVIRNPLDIDLLKYINKDFSYEERKPENGKSEKVVETISFWERTKRDDSAEVDENKASVVRIIKDAMTNEREDEVTCPICFIISNASLIFKADKIHERGSFILRDAVSKAQFIRTDKGVFRSNVMIFLMEESIPSEFPPYLIKEGRELRVGLPSREERDIILKERFKKWINEVSEKPVSEQERLKEEFLSATDGMRMRDIKKINTLVLAKKIPYNKCTQAVSIVKNGVEHDVWLDGNLEKKIDSGKVSEILDKKVIGADEAKKKCIEQLKFAVNNYRDVESSLSGPKGVLFLAGPTGVGKTELTIALKEAVFGESDNHYGRIDCGMLTGDDAVNTLLGSAAGYIRSDEKGLLETVLPEKGYGILVFDEIEKANDNVKKMLLSILDYGRVKANNNNELNFKNTFIVFTSNVGISNRDGTLRCFPDMSEKELRDNVESENNGYNDNRLFAPEFRGRIGDGFVIIPFISRDMAKDIGRSKINEYLTRIEKLHGLNIMITADAWEKIDARYLNLGRSEGGRAITKDVHRKVLLPIIDFLAKGMFSSGDKLQISDIDFEKDSIRMEKI